MNYKILCVFDRAPVRGHRRLCDSERSKQMNNWLAEELMNILKGDVITLYMVSHVITNSYLIHNSLLN